jgi:hypothetical protein
MHRNAYSTRVLIHSNNFSALFWQELLIGRYSAFVRTSTFCCSQQLHVRGTSLCCESLLLRTNFSSAWCPDLMHSSCFLIGSTALFEPFDLTDFNGATVNWPNAAPSPGSNGLVGTVSHVELSPSRAAFAFQSFSPKRSYEPLPFRKGCFRTRRQIIC